MATYYENKALNSTKDSLFL